MVWMVIGVPPGHKGRIGHHDHTHFIGQTLIRVPAQPYLRFDTNDYSLDPRLAGRRVEVRVSQTELTAVALDTGELAGRHRRRFARHLTFTDSAHQAELDELRGARRRGSDVDVELRPLARYDALIPA